MTLKENSNGNCFAAWLQEYKTRLQQVHVERNGNNGQCTAAASGKPDAEQRAEEKKSSSPAVAGESSALLQRPLVA